jgi:hypothetical protein
MLVKPMHEADPINGPWHFDIADNNPDTRSIFKLSDSIVGRIGNDLGSMRKCGGLPNSWDRCP